MTEFRNSRWGRRCIVIVCLLGSFFALECVDKDKADTFVQDEAGMLSAAQRSRIDRLNRKLLADLDIHFQVVILAESPPDLNAKAVQMFAENRIGESTRGKKGLLFIVDPPGRAARLEVGYDLEGLFTDAFSGYVEREQLKPFYVSGRVGPGIEASVELLVGKVMDAMRAGSYDARRRIALSDGSGSGGAGARIDLNPDAAAPSKRPTTLSGAFQAQAEPLLTLKVYMHVLKAKIKDPDLGIYTPDTRSFFSKWTVTDAQMNNELKGLERVIGSAESLFQGSWAVIRFPIGDRRNAPYFFQKGTAGWMLDFAAMNELVGFNHKNQWFFRRLDHAYAFAFADLHFDKHGFPHRKK